MADIQGFPAISRPDARLLILGSMPGRESLLQQRYYAHPRNAFWPVVSDLFALKATSYEEKARELTLKGVAVWDVLKACFRSSSLDSDIDDRSIVSNDFAQFYTLHPDITRVFFNGAKAESVYLKHVQPGLQGVPARLKLHRLPSTSPAHAAMSLEQKKEAWRIILD